MKIIKSHILDGIITITTNNMLSKKFSVSCNDYYLRKIILYTELNNNGVWYTAVEDDYIKKIKDCIINENKK